jgi:hypothetical protein
MPSPESRYHQQHTERLEQKGTVQQYAITSAATGENQVAAQQTTTHNFSQHPQHPQPQPSSSTLLVSSNLWLAFKIRDHGSFPFPRWPRPPPPHSFSIPRRRSDFDAQNLRASADRTTRPLSAELPRLRMAFSFDNGGGNLSSATPIPTAGTSAQTGSELLEIHTEVCFSG